MAVFISLWAPRGQGPWFDSLLDPQYLASIVLGQSEKFDKYLLISEEESVKELKCGFLPELLFRTAMSTLPPVEANLFFF